MHRRPERLLFALILLVVTGIGFGIPVGALADSPGPPANVTFSPGVTTKTVGEFVTEVATVTDASGNLVADGTPGAWSVTVPGSSPANITRMDTITKDGQVTLTFTTGTVGVAQITFTAGYEPNTARGSTSITWVAEPPPSTARAALNIVSPFSPSIVAMVQTNAHGGAPHGQLLYMSSEIRLRQVQFMSLVVNGNQATLYGAASLADGTPVIFQLDATEGRNAGTVRLRLSTGYDSGTQTAAWVQIKP